MFKWIFYYLNNNINTPANLFKINIWFFLNLKIFKIKLTNYLVYFISSINNLKFKKIKIFYKDFYFEYFYFYFIKFFFFLFLFLLFLI